MEKVTTVSINNKEYKFFNPAYLLLSGYNKFLKKTIRDSNKLSDIEIQISVLLDMEIENRKTKNIVDTEMMHEIISVLKENRKIYYHKRKFKQKQQVSKKRELNGFKLRKDSRNNVFGGVCSGIASRFNVDPALIRILFVALTIITGFFAVLYIALWIVLPSEKTNYSKSF